MRMSDETIRLTSRQAVKNLERKVFLTEQKGLVAKNTSTRNVQAQADGTYVAMLTKQAYEKCAV